MTTLRSILFAGAVAALSCVSASANVVTALPGGTVLSMPGNSQFSAGPIQLAPGVTWSSQSGSSVYGYNGGYGFAGNGSWNGMDMMGSNSGSAVMTLTFAAPVAGIGAFFNYAPGYGTPVIAAYDVNNQLIESLTLSFGANANNGGQFEGFLENTANIKSFRMSGAYIGATNVTVQRGAAVPEPATLALFSLGLLGLGALRRQRSH